MGDEPVVLSAAHRPERSEGKDLHLSAPEGFEHVAQLGDLEGRGLLAVQLSNGDRICLIEYKGKVTAVRDLCTHQAFPLSEGDLLPNGRLVCAWHGAEFDCANGRVCRGPALDDLDMYDVRLVGSDILVRASR